MVDRNMGVGGAVGSLFASITTINLVAFTCMVLSNAENLESVEFKFAVAGTDTTISLYDIFEASLGIFIVITLMSLFSSSIAPLFKWLCGALFYYILSMGVVYYLSIYPPLSSTYLVITSAVLVLYIAVKGMEVGPGG